MKKRGKGEDYLPWMLEKCQDLKKVKREIQNVRALKVALHYHACDLYALQSREDSNSFVIWDPERENKQMIHVLSNDVYLFQ